MIFKIQKNDGNARAGELSLFHSVIETPFFMPIATVGGVKNVSSKELESLDPQIILSNTYHLHIRPGDELIKNAGGLHNFMNFHKSILTDSGGFQVFSLAKIRDIGEEGVNFRSHIDGQKIFLSPEKVVDIQKNLGVDIMMTLDECPPIDGEKKYIENSINRTFRWEKRAFEHFQKNCDREKQKIFGIIQGGIYEDLRKLSASQITSIDFDGFAIGGVSVGEKTEDIYRVLDFTTNLLPPNKPRYLMGVGYPENIIEAVSRGIDMFDCVLPTRNARHGKLFTTYGEINIKAGKYKEDFGKIDEENDNYYSQNYTKAYLRHLFNVGEGLGMIIATIHNISFYLNLMKKIRKSILENKFEEFKSDFFKKYKLNSNRS